MGSIGKVRQGLIDGEAVTTDSLSAGCVTTVKLADLNVTTAKLSLSAVTANNLALTAVQTRHIGPLVITNPKYAPLSITTDKIALSAITTELMAITAIQTRHINVSAVTWEKMAANSVRTINIQLSAITNNLLALTAVQTRHIEVSAVTQEKLATEAVQIQNVHPNTSLLFSNRNAIINGAMNIFQRALSANAASNYPGYSTADRFFIYQEGGNSQISTRRESISTFQPGLSGFQNCIRWGRVPGGTSLGTTVFGQVVESIVSVPFENSPATLSFYARCGTTFSSELSVLNVKLYTGCGEDQAATSMVSGAWVRGSIPINQNITLTSTWQRFSFNTYIRPDVTQLGFTLSWTPSATSLRPPNGPVGGSFEDDNVYLTGIQLERSWTPTPYEYIPITREINDCQRFYEKSYNQNISVPTNTTAGAIYNGIDGVSNAIHTGRLSIRFMTTKRDTPRVAVYSTNTSAFNRIYDSDNGVDYVATILTGSIGRTGFSATCTTNAVTNYLLIAHYTADSEFF